MMIEFIPKRKLRLPGHENKLGEWLRVIEYAIFLRGLAQQWGRDRNEMWHKGSLADEDDAWTSNTRIAQRKRAIPCSTMENMTCVLEPMRCSTAHRTRMSWQRSVTSPKLSLRTSMTTSHVTCFKFSSNVCKVAYCRNIFVNLKIKLCTHFCHKFENKILCRRRVISNYLLGHFVFGHPVYLQLAYTSKSAAWAR